jgi:hypothetical protein
MLKFIEVAENTPPLDDASDSNGTASMTFHRRGEMNEDSSISHGTKKSTVHKLIGNRNAVRMPRTDLLTEKLKKKPQRTSRDLSEPSTVVVHADTGSVVFKGDEEASGTMIVHKDDASEAQEGSGTMIVHKDESSGTFVIHEEQNEPELVVLDAQPVAKSALRSPIAPRPVVASPVVKASPATAKSTFPVKWIIFVVIAAIVIAFVGVKVKHYITPPPPPPPPPPGVVGYLNELGRWYGFIPN